MRVISISRDTYGFRAHMVLRPQVNKYGGVPFGFTWLDFDILLELVCRRFSMVLTPKKKKKVML